MNKNIQIILFYLFIFLFLVIIIANIYFIIILFNASILENFTDKFDAFCKTQIGGVSKCSSLTQNNCNKTSCCVWLNDNNTGQCVKGNSKGPIFNTDKNGKTIKSTYYYMNKCYGAKC